MQEYEPIKEGKVREVYDNGDSLIIVATDRISAFDHILKNKIAKKGKNAGEAYQTTVAYVNDVTHALQVIYGRETRKWVAEHEATLKEAAKAFNKIAKEIKEFGKKYDM